ncbi:hypothetical protein BKA66DRAFT_94817 [Pyrenochaeta sp. MPI-SDFR-AT-0127]|nr:hypothetical protein BKA66DRAFT_94817 [Pyrenochaeta sp. MPI-SDFR-AT-0127]
MTRLSPSSSSRHVSGRSPDSLVRECVQPAFAYSRIDVIRRKVQHSALPTASPCMQPPCQMLLTRPASQITGIHPPFRRQCPF